MKIEVVKPTLKESLANVKTRRTKLSENLKDLPADINEEEVAVRPDGDVVALQALEKDREVVKDRLEEHQKALDDFIYQEEEHRKKAEKESKKMKVESINVKDRKELSKVLKEAQKANKTFKISRSLEEGFRYTVELTENLATFDDIVDLDSDLYDATRDVVEAWVKRGASFNDFTTSFENCLLHAEDDLECLEDGWDKHDADTEKPVEEIEESLKKEIKIKDQGNDLINVGFYETSDDGYEVKIGKGENGKEVFVSRPSHSYTSIEELESDIEAAKKCIELVKEFESREGVNPLGHSFKSRKAESLEESCDESCEECKEEKIEEAKKTIKVKCIQDYMEDDDVGEAWSKGIIYDAQPVDSKGNRKIRTNQGNWGEVGPDFLLDDFDEYFEIITESTKDVCEKCGKEVCECDKQEARNLEEDLKLIIDISEYEPWSGAVETWDKIVEAGKVDDLGFMLEDIYPEGLTRTELNDILWFEPEWVLDMLGLSDGAIEDEFEDEEPVVEEALEENKSLKEDEDELPAVEADIRAETEVADEDDEEKPVFDDELELLDNEEGHADEIEVGAELADFDGSEVIPEDELEVKEDSKDLEASFEPAEEVKDVWEKIKEAGKTEKFFETARLLSDDIENEPSAEELNKLLAETDWIKEFLEIE